MSNRPPISWSSALRELKSDRLKRQPVREERLRTTQGLRGAPALALSAWRGQSGRRYVVGVHPIDTFDVSEAGQAVVLFVRRDADGISALASGADSPDTLDAGLLVTRAMLAGCTEIHIHRLAEDAAERMGILADLNASVMEAA